MFSEGLFGPLEFDAAVRDVVTPLRRLNQGDDNSVTDVRARERLLGGHRRRRFTCRALARGLRSLVRALVLASRAAAIRRRDPRRR